MEQSARLFNCTNCYCHNYICSKCDRGHIYCKKCAALARGKSQRAASKTYQSTRQGKLNHAKRQQIYHQRQTSKMKNMTHHTSTDLLHSLPSIKPDLLIILKNTAAITTKSSITCDFCSCNCSNFLRVNFLQHSTNKLHNVNLGQEP